MSEALIIVNYSSQAAAIPEHADAMVQSALAKGALVGRVTCAEEQQAAVDAQKEVAGVLNQFEKARQAAKRPVIDIGVAIDTEINKRKSELMEEKTRLGRLLGDFEALEQAKIRAAQKAESDRLTQLERERQAELAKAQSHDELDAIQTKFDERAAAESTPPPAPTRVEGQIIKPDWDITVTNIHDLYRAHPNCVKMEARLSEIKSLLNMGVKVHGVTAVRVTNATVRAERAPLTIEA